MMSPATSVCALTAATALFLGGCGNSEPAASPTAPASAPELAEVSALAKKSVDCSLTYYRSVNFSPDQQKVILERGKLAELAADANEYVHVEVADYNDIMKPTDDRKQAEVYIVALQNADSPLNHLTPERLARAQALDAYYEAMSAPASCAPDPRVLKFAGKAAT